MKNRAAGRSSFPSVHRETALIGVYSKTDVDKGTERERELLAGFLDRVDSIDHLGKRHTALVEHGEDLIIPCKFFLRNTKCTYARQWKDVQLTFRKENICILSFIRYYIVIILSYSEHTRCFEYVVYYERE